MKNSQKGFVVPLIITIVVLLLVGGIIYVSVKNNPKNQSISNTNDNGASSSNNTNVVNPGNNVVKSISVISPKGGETFVSGQKVNITWTTPGYELTKAVNIYLLRTDETATAIIVKNTANTGSYQWTVPTVTSSMSYVISVHIPDGNDVDSIDNPYSASSASPFTINPVVSTPHSDTLTYTGTTGTGTKFTVQYPSSWVYYKYSCNLDGVAFWPKNIAPDLSNVNCSLNGPISTAPIIIYTEQIPNIVLGKPGYETVFNQMKASLLSKDVSTWVTYSGYGISFEYPSAMGQPAITQTSTRTSISFANSVTFEIGAYYNQNVSRFETLDEVIQSAVSNPDVSNPTKEQVIVYGKTGTKLTYTSKTTGGGQTDVFVPVDTKGNILVVSQYGRAVSNVGGVGIDQILPTLQFTK